MLVSGRTDRGHLQDCSGVGNGSGWSRDYGDIGDVRMVVISLLLLLTLLALATLTMLALLGPVTGLLLSISLLLPGEVGVAAFAADGRELISLLLTPVVPLRSVAAHRFQLELHKDSFMDIDKGDVRQGALLSDNRDKHLPFLRECSK